MIQSGIKKSRREAALSTWRKMVKYKWLYLILLPMIIHTIVFKYSTQYGILMAFKDYKFSKGILGSPWVGFYHFKMFFNSEFGRLMLNTLRMTVSSLIFGFPLPIILAIMINEVRFSKFQKVVQTVTYLPHFVSWVVVISMFTTLLSPHDGLVNEFLVKVFGIEPIYFMGEKNLFIPMYLVIGAWKDIGWGSILFLAAIAGIDQEMYEAAEVDGAGKFRKMWSITLPCLVPTIVIKFLMGIGGLVNVGFDIVYLMQTPTNLEISEAINTYTLKQGLQAGNYSYATAIGFFQSVMAFLLVYTFNRISRKVTETALW